MKIPVTLANFVHTPVRLLLLIIGVTALLLFVIIFAAPEPGIREVDEATFPVNTIVAGRTSVSPELTLYGRIETPRDSTLKSAVSAHVRSVPVREGDNVEAGAILVHLEEIDAQLNLDRCQSDVVEANANLASLKLKSADNRLILEHQLKLHDLLRKKLERHEHLRANKTISEETLNAVRREYHQSAISLQNQQGLVNDVDNQLARAESQLQRAITARKAAEVQLDRTAIHAPFDGRVTRVLVSPGELVAPGTIVAHIYDDSSLEVRAQIPARHLAELQRALAAGKEITAAIQIDGESVPARLERLSGEVGTGRSSVDGLFGILKEDNGLQLGQAVSLNLSLPVLKDVIAVPVQAMYGNDRLFIVQEDRLQAVTVERVGESRDDQGHFTVLVRSAEVPDGARILTSQLSNAMTGLKVSTGDNNREVADKKTATHAANGGHLDST